MFFSFFIHSELGFLFFPIHLTVPECTTAVLIGWLDCQKSHLCRELVWGCLCEESNIKDAYFHIRNDSFFEFMASMAVLSVAVCCLSAYIIRADGQVGQRFGNDGQSLVQFGQNQHGFGRVLG